MSPLSLPRIHFQGECVTNVDTANLLEALRRKPQRLQVLHVAY